MFYISSKINSSFTKKFLTFILISCLATNSFAKEPALKKDSVAKKAPMLETFYSINHEPLYWLSSRKNIKRASEWLTELEQSREFGLVPDEVQINQIRAGLLNKNKKDNALREKTDKQLTGMILNFIKEMQEGTVSFEYDEVRAPRDSIYIYLLRNARYKASVAKIVSRFDCKDPDYLVLKKYLKDSISRTDSLKFKKIALAMNYLRYLSVNKKPDYIVANIPETEARYYQNDLLALKMKTVVGKKKNQTPRIASYITDIVTFPYWNVPYSIASKELLPKVQKDETYLERKNFEVVDGKGNVVDDSDLNWDSYTKTNFPYFFRESTGPNNSLGVLKFNLKNPFSIYLHDTNAKAAFARDYRFLSHGCVRLEKPIELADLLTKGKIDDWNLKTGKKDTESKTIMLTQKVPVFIIYMPVVVDGQKVTFLKDVYGLVQ